MSNSSLKKGNGFKFMILGQLTGLLLYNIFLKSHTNQIKQIFDLFNNDFIYYISCLLALNLFLLPFVSMVFIVMTNIEMDNKAESKFKLMVKSSLLFSFLLLIPILPRLFELNN